MIWTNKIIIAFGTLAFMLIGVIVFIVGFYLLIYRELDWLTASWVNSYSNVGIMLIVTGIVLATIGLILLIKSMMKST